MVSDGLFVLEQLAGCVAEVVEQRLPTLAEGRATHLLQNLQGPQEITLGLWVSVKNASRYLASPSESKFLLRFLEARNSQFV